MPRMHASSTVLVKNVRNRTCDGNQRMQVSSRKSVSRLIRNKSSFILRSGAGHTLRRIQRRALGRRSGVDRAPAYERAADREVVAFIAAALAFGRVQSVLNSIEGMLAVMGPSPAAFVREFDPSRDRKRFDHLVHRWTNGAGLRGAGVDPASDDRAERLDRRLLRRRPA